MSMNITKSPLPNLGTPRIEKLKCTNPNRLSTYTIILQAEEQAVKPEDLMSARVVGYLLLEFHDRRLLFGDKPCSELDLWVTSPLTAIAVSQNDVVYQLGTDLRDKFIRLFRTSNTHYQPPSSHPSRPSFDVLEEMIKDTLDITNADRRTPRQKTLARDNFRCMVTGFLDRNSVKRCPDLLQKAGSDTTMAVIETAHILNESTMQGIDPEGTCGNPATMNRTDHDATAMAMLESLGFPDFVEVFRIPRGVHQVWNLLSLQYDLYSYFASLELWFEGTERSGRYKICVSHNSHEGFIRRNFQRPGPHVDGAPMVVEFTSQREHAPPPDPRLLALHATCARAAHMSGAAEFFDKIDCDEENTQVLASDGSSALLLGHLLTRFATLEATNYKQARA